MSGDDGDDVEDGQDGNDSVSGGDGNDIVLTTSAPVLSAALFARFSSRGEATYADKVLSAMRKQFGGHQESKKG